MKISGSKQLILEQIADQRDNWEVYAIQDALTDELYLVIRIFMVGVVHNMNQRQNQQSEQQTLLSFRVVFGIVTGLLTIGYIFTPKQAIAVLLNN